MRNYTRTSQTGYESQVTVYECEDCSDCPLKEKCTKAKGNCQLHVAKEFLAYRETAQENILTEAGKLYRMNRSHSGGRNIRHTERRLSTEEVSYERNRQCTK
ncbi:transposase [Oceanobacillus sp. FSL K6-0251]|uniref:transposase n=1 Tax=Oceanobacillus sp. FSL K6-0251 TaxID=2921602 RepID=UPI004046E248